MGCIPACIDKPKKNSSRKREELKTEQQPSEIIQAVRKFPLNFTLL